MTAHEGNPAAGPGAVASQSSDLALQRSGVPAMARTLALRLGSVVVSRELVWTFAAVGAALRIRQYLVNRSFWLDESFLSINVIEKPFTKLFGPLQFNQAAPPGFLLVERLATDVFGRSEYVFRAFPLACGLVSIFLFVRLARRLLPSEVG